MSRENDIKRFIQGEEAMNGRKTPADVVARLKARHGIGEDTSAWLDVLAPNAVQRPVTAPINKGQVPPTPPNTGVAMPMRRAQPPYPSSAGAFADDKHELTAAERISAAEEYADLGLFADRSAVRLPQLPASLDDNQQSHVPSVAHPTDQLSVPRQVAVVETSPAKKRSRAPIVISLLATAALAGISVKAGYEWNEQPAQPSQQLPANSSQRVSQGVSNGQ